MNVTLALIWLVAVLAIGSLVYLRFPEAIKKLVPAKAKSGEAAAKATASPYFWRPILGATTKYPSVWVILALTFSAIWMVSHSVIEERNIFWIPFFFIILRVIFGRAAWISRMASKEKKCAHPTLEALRDISWGIVVFSLIVLTIYFAKFAPAGAWEKVAMKGGGLINDAPSKHVAIPSGIPRNPQFASTQLENWNVYFVLSNSQYRAPQAPWSGKRVGLAKEPAREVTDVVNLTVTFDPKNDKLDIIMQGSCKRPEEKTASISKICAGWWKDRGGQISGEFCLGVTEAAPGRSFDVQLYDGNYLPPNCLTQKGAEGFFGKIPHMRLQFRPKEWKEEN